MAVRGPRGAPGAVGDDVDDGFELDCWPLLEGDVELDCTLLADGADCDGDWPDVVGADGVADCDCTPGVDRPPVDDWPPADDPMDD
jgi:hypothetical protein